jgi:hypothetical protein
MPLNAIAAAPLEQGRIVERGTRQSLLAAGDALRADLGIAANAWLMMDNLAALQ